MINWFSPSFKNLPPITPGFSLPDKSSIWTPVIIKIAINVNSTSKATKEQGGRKKKEKRSIKKKEGRKKGENMKESLRGLKILGGRGEG